MPLTRIAFLSLCLMGSSVGSGATSLKDSPSVEKRLAAAKTSALKLKADAAELTAYVRDTDRAFPEKMRILKDIHAADETLAELEEMKKVASPRQADTIQQVIPLTQDLVENARDCLEHATAIDGTATHETRAEYLAGHEEVVNHLVSQIVEALSGQAK